MFLKASPSAISNFAADSGVIRRGTRVLKGKNAIRDFYVDPDPRNIRTWNPTYVDVSRSGDLASTYGTYQFTRFDSLGNPLVNEGIFHTVWKRQENGEWRFVYD